MPIINILYTSAVILSPELHVDRYAVNISLHDAIDNYVITSGLTTRIAMYGSCKRWKGSYFARLYLKVYLVSVIECCRCCNRFVEVYKDGVTSWDRAPEMMPGPPPHRRPLSRLPTLNFGKTWSQAVQQSYSSCTAILPSCLLYM